MHMDIPQLSDEEVFRMSSEALKTGGHIFVYDLLFLRFIENEARWPTAIYSRHPFVPFSEQKILRRPLCCQFLRSFHLSVHLGHTTPPVSPREWFIHLILSTQKP